MAEVSLLALDLGSVTGVAEWPSGRLQTWKLQGKTRVQKFAHFTKLLEMQLSAGGYDAVVFERPIARGRAATRMGWGLAGIVEATAELEGYPSLDAEISTVKKAVTGRGDADKDMVILSMSLRGWTPANEHEADAAAVAHYAAENLMKQKESKT